MVIEEVTDIKIKKTELYKLLEAQVQTDLGKTVTVKDMKVDIHNPDYWIVVTE